MKSWEKNLPLVLLCLIVAFTSVCLWIVESPAVPRQKLLQLHEGMTAVEVERIMGKPIKIYGSQRVYGSRWKWNHLKIDFDTEFKMKSIDLDDR